jgi:hypothetical protein
VSTYSSLRLRFKTLIPSSMSQNPMLMLFERHFYLCFGLPKNSICCCLTPAAEHRVIFVSDITNVDANRLDIKQTPTP